MGYIKDNKQDFGYPNSYPFYWGAFDKSPDIWVRNQPDGFINQKHQTPQYSATQPVYVYVRVWNKSCVSSGEQGNLKLYWSKASSSSSWPQDWTGVNTNGDVIGTQAIPNLAPGESTILQFQWNIPNPHQFNNWNSCLLARIESISSDPIQSYSLLENQVYYNNNVALHNVSIVDKLPNTSYSNPMFTSLVRGGRGTFMYIGNVQDTPENYDITFGLPIEEISPSIAQQGEIHVMTDSVGWGILYPALAENPDVRIVGERHFRILSDTVILHNLTFPANTRSQIYVGFNFLIENIANEDSIFLYRVLQRYSDSTEHSTGAENFVIRKFPRDMFYVNAGDDKTIHKGESVLLQAADIGEPAIYNWYDQSGNLISSEMEVNVSPNATTSYTLEVIATADGYKDYDGVTVNVKQFWIESIVPNPTEANTVVSYNIEGAASNANLKLADQTGTVLHSYTLSIDSSELEINVSSYAGGAYNIILEVDGNNVDAKTLIIQ